MNPVCPICGGRMIDDAARDQLKSLIYANGCTSATHNPGGAEFWFKDKGRLQIGAMCDHCDLETVREFLA